MAMFHDLSSQHTPCPWQIVIQSNITFDGLETCPCPSQLQRWMFQDFLPTEMPSSRTSWRYWQQVNSIYGELIDPLILRYLESTLLKDFVRLRHMLKTCWTAWWIWEWNWGNLSTGLAKTTIEIWVCIFERTIEHLQNFSTYIWNGWRASRLYLRSSCSHSSESSPLSPPM